MKVGGGIGTAVSGWLLSASGYDGHLSVQPGSAIQMIYIMYVWLPLIANAKVPSRFSSPRMYFMK